MRTVPDFPKPGILFYDITTLLKDKDGLRNVIDRMTEQIAPLKPDYVMGIEARGFIFAPAVADKLGAGFIRKSADMQQLRTELDRIINLNITVNYVLLDQHVSIRYHKQSEAQS